MAKVRKLRKRKIKLRKKNVTQKPRFLQTIVNRKRKHVRLSVNLKTNNPLAESHERTTSSVGNDINDVDRLSQIANNFEAPSLQIIVKEASARQIFHCCEQSLDAFKQEFSELLTEIPQKYGNKFVKLITRHSCFRHFPKDVRT